jgi:tetratricopeptide (TPR) repeat protein
MNSPDVFVSYASPDRAIVEQIVPVLEAAGLSVWWDRNITTGHAFDRDIEAALDAARCVLVLWSAASVDSDWVRAEAAEGLDRGVLVPVALGEVRPPLAFRRLQTLRVEALAGEAPAAVLDAVRKVLPLELQVAPEPFPNGSLPSHGKPEAPRSRPQVACLVDDSGAGDPGVAAVAHFLENEIAGYLAMWPRGDLAAGDAAEDADYRLHLRIASDGKQRRISCVVESQRSGRRQQASATAPIELSLSEQEDLACALFRFADRSILADLREQLAALDPSALDYWGLVNVAEEGVSGRETLQRAVEMAPERGLGYALLARAAVIGRISFVIPRTEISMTEIRDLAMRGVQLDPVNPLALSEASYVLALTGQAQNALPLAQEAGQLFRPCGAIAQFPLVRLGRGVEALQISDAMTRWGLPVIPAHWAARAEAQAVERAYDKVEEAARRGILRAGSQESVLRAHYANALVNLDRREEALEQWRRAQALAPGFTVAGWVRGWSRQMARPELVDALTGGLRALEST